MVAARYPVIIESLRRKTSEVRNAPARYHAGNLNLGSFGSHEEMRGGRNLARLVLEDTLIAIKRETEFHIPGNAEYGERQACVESADLVCDRPCG